MLAESPDVTLYTEGFSRFVTSTTAPIATGRSESCRVGLSPLGDRAFTAHVEDESKPHIDPPRAVNPEIGLINYNVTL
jgi:hypothetical protein